MSLHLFEAFGVELEYMIVDTASLDVRPITDKLLEAVTGEHPPPTETDLEHNVSWSNELALHVVELKTTGPVPRLAGVADRFQASVARANSLLSDAGARLMPSAMHPWMDPFKEMRLWPHGYSPVYETFNRIFDCRGHGWANLQSVHLNLPFSGDEEFARLHAAIRLILPILPALTAASPVMDARVTGAMDNRLEVYRTNARRVPSVSGSVIPEPVFTRADYERRILDRVYADLAPLDPEGVLRHEWANARGAIARFERDAIEIRVMDVQECPAADVAICATVAGVLRAMVGERWAGLAEQKSWAVEPLLEIFSGVVRDAERAEITDAAYLGLFGLPAPRATAGELWRHLYETTRPAHRDDDRVREPVETILSRGPLARRIVGAIGPRHPGGAADRDRLRAVYAELCDCLAQGRMFRGVG